MVGQAPELRTGTVADWMVFAGNVSCRPATSNCNPVRNRSGRMVSVAVALAVRPCESVAVHVTSAELAPHSPDQAMVGVIDMTPHASSAAALASQASLVAALAGPQVRVRSAGVVVNTGRSVSCTMTVRSAVAA